MPTDDRPFPLVATVILAAEEGDYARAARAQERLRELGWHFSRRPADELKPPAQRAAKRALAFEGGK
jgi:hypothetical protein